MSKIVWDQLGEKIYETGTKHGVLYPSNGSTYDTGVAWNGLTGVTDSPSGAELTSLYADDIKYANMQSAEEWGGTIEAYTYPDEFKQCDGSKEVAPGVYIGQQKRKSFGFVWTTTIGNDTDGNSHGEKIHIAYGCLASPSEKGYQTINDSPDAITFSWEVKATPVNVTGGDPTATMEIDSTKTTAEKWNALKDKLFGADGTMQYVEFTGTAFVQGTTYYERTGAGTSESPYVYTPTEDTSYNSEKTYYTRELVGDEDPTLLMPDEIVALMGTQATPGQG